MNENLAKVIYKPNNIEVVKTGTHVICSVSGKKIPLNNLVYWNVELQEAYYSPKEVKIRYQQINEKK